jgi:hypothetical protein
LPSLYRSDLQTHISYEGMITNVIYRCIAHRYTPTIDIGPPAREPKSMFYLYVLHL